MFPGFEPHGDDEYISIDNRWRLVPVGLMWVITPAKLFPKSIGHPRMLMATVRARKFITDQYEKRVPAFVNFGEKFEWSDTLDREWEVEVSKHKKAAANIQKIS